MSSNVPKKWQQWLGRGLKALLNELDRQAKTVAQDRVEVQQVLAELTEAPAKGEAVLKRAWAATQPKRRKKARRYKTGRTLSPHVRLVRLAKKAGDDGIRSVHLRPQVGLSKSVYRRVVRELVRDGKVTESGNKTARRIHAA